MREGERDVVALHFSNACSDSTRLSVRRTSWMCSRIPALSILPASTTCGAGGIVRQPVLQFSVLGLLALQGTSTTAPGGGESYPYMGICHGPPRSVRRPPPRAIHTQSTHKESSQLSRLHERGVLDRAQRHYRAFLLGFLERGVPDRAEALSRSDPPPYSSFRPFDIKSCHGAEQRHAAPTIIVMSIDPPPRSHHSPAQLSRSHPVWDRTASWTFSALSRARLRWTSSAHRWLCVL